VSYVRLHSASSGATDVRAILSALTVSYGDVEVVPESNHDMCLDSFKRELSSGSRSMFQPFTALDVRVGDYLVRHSRFTLGSGSSVP